MSQLVALLSSSKYDRLNQLEAHSPNVVNPKAFSVRNQSGLTENNGQNTDLIQANAVDFFGNTYQEGFNTFKPTLSTEGFRKSDLLTNIESDFTGNASIADIPTNETKAFYTYARHTADTLRTTYKSQLVHRYLATNTTKQYAGEGNWPETPAGLILSYTPAL